jgi:hypothetical protein
MAKVNLDSASRRSVVKGAAALAVLAIPQLGPPLSVWLNWRKVMH